MLDCILFAFQEHLSIDSSRLAAEKADLENALEAEQEYIMHKLHKQVRRSQQCMHMDVRADPLPCSSVSNCVCGDSGQKLCAPDRLRCSLKQ